MKTRKNNDIACWLSFPDWQSFFPPSLLGLDPYQSIYNLLVKTSCLSPVNCIRYIHPFIFPFVFYFPHSPWTLRLLTAHLASPPNQLDIFFFIIYSCHSLYFVTIHHQFIHPLNIFAEGLLCVVAQTQCPHFHHLLLTRENRAIWYGLSPWSHLLYLPPSFSPLFYSQPLGKGGLCYSLYFLSSYSFIKPLHPGCFFHHFAEAAPTKVK